MSDLTAILHTTYNAVENRQIVKPGRSYLGMSSIGKECSRALWYQWRWAYPVILTPRSLRLFERGDMEEERIVRDLKNAGIFCYRVDEQGNEHEITGEIGEEQEEVAHFTGHCLGHLDGRARNIPEAPKTDHLLEMKTMAEKYFKALVKSGVQETFPEYYAQMQIYMYYTGLKRALFVATNKNTEERWYERVHYDPAVGNMLNRKILDILTAEEPPKRISETPDFFKCRWCAGRDVCFGTKEHQHNCRTCTRADLHDAGVWKCNVSGTDIPLNIQRIGCESHYKTLL